GLGILGASIGGPLGGIAGTILGGLLFPHRPVNVAGLRVSAPQKGAVLPVLYGTQRVPGNFIWYGNFNTTGPGKGGKGPQTGGHASYSASFALAICEGVEPPNAITLLRIFAGKNVIWNADGS